MASTDRYNGDRLSPKLHFGQKNLSFDAILCAVRQLKRFSVRLASRATLDIMISYASVSRPGLLLTDRTGAQNCQQPTR
jgi:hypothetical protein